MFCDDDEFRFNDASTHEGHLRQNGELTWFCNETIIMISHNPVFCDWHYPAWVFSLIVLFIYYYFFFTIFDRKVIIYILKLCPLNLQ